MDKQKEKKVSAKLPQLINKNKNLAALVSKLRKEDSSKDDKNTGNNKAINTNNLPAISESIKDKILNNETIVKLFPDIELSIQILTSSILAPNDMGSTNLIYLNNDTKIPTEIKIGILDAIKTYISTNYKLEDKLSTIVREAMFTKGAYVEAIIPEAAIDAMINENSTEVSIESFVEKNNNEKKISILGIEDSDLKYSLEDMNISLTKKDNIKKEVDLTLKISEEELMIDITDNFALLGISKKLSDNVIDKISTEMYKDEKIDKKEENQFEKLFKDMKDVKDKTSVTILTLDQLDKETVGKPLVIKLPVESVIPVHVTGDKSKHLGYFVMLNEKGTPIGRTSTVWDAGNSDYNNDMAKKAKSVIDKANTAINGFSKSEPTLDDMEDIYSHIITAKIKKRLSGGMLGDLAAIEEDNTDVYRVMMTRMLKKQKTKLLFIPSELVSYYAFKYRDNGTGESLLETITVLSSIRAILLFARIMANVKNSVTTTEVNATLDEQDVDPSKTMTRIISEVMKNRQTQLPIGVTRVEDLVDWTRKVGYKFNFKHPDLPEMDITSNETNSSKVVPDAAIDEEIRKQILMAFALPPKAVEDGYDSDFATTIVQSNILFTKRVVAHQDTLLPLITDHVKKLIKNDRNLYDLIQDNINENMTMIKKYIKKSTLNKDFDFKKINETNLAKWLTNEYINTLEVELPRIEETKTDNMKEAFNAYKTSLDDVVDMFLGSDSVPNSLVGVLGDKLEDVKFAIKNSLLRKWMSDNNYMEDFLKATSLDPDNKPMLDIYSEFNVYIDGLADIIKPFLEELNKRKEVNDADLNKIDGDNEEESDDNNDNTDDTGDDNTDNGGDQVGDDETEDNVGDDAGDNTGDDNADLGDDGLDAPKFGDDNTDDEEKNKDKADDADTGIEVPKF